MSTGEVYLWGALTEGEIAAQKHLRGKKVKTLCGGYSSLMVLADGYSMHWLNDGDTKEIDDAMEDVKVGQVVVGSKHAAALTLDGELYTWGNGEQGQLGLGGSALNSPIPQQVNIRGCVFRQIACGSEHMAAVSDNGDLYTWGRGFEGQTGHASKTADKITNDNITGVQLIPKFVAAFMGTAVRKVSCGQHFTLCLTESGEVHSFGEGQSGQLGTGRCSKRVLPEKVLDCAPTNQAPIVDCDAGWAHSLVLSSSGEVFVWGFNLYGQLGLGDNKTRFFPEQLISDAPGFKIDKICAASHYSAALTSYGELFTWGSGTDAKLGHGDTSHKLVPTLVEKLMGRMPQELSCGEKSMCAFSPTCVCSLQPTCGPVAGKTHLVLEGAGYWPSDDITVRFVPLPGPDGVLPNIAPRAAIGKYVDDTHISCKTPKLSAPCTVKVEVALNGKSFTTDAKEFTFYPVPHLDAIAPGMTHTRGGEELIIMGTDLHDADRVLVRFAAEQQIWDVEGAVVTEEPEVFGEEEGEMSYRENSPEPGDGPSEGADAAGAEATRKIVVCAPVCVPKEEEDEPALPLPIHTSVAVSFNGQDFHPLSGPQLVHHAARLEGVVPQCANVTGGLPLKIKGTSLFDSGGVQVHFVFPPEPKEPESELDEDGNPAEKSEEAGTEVGPALDADGNPIPDEPILEGKVIVVPAVCLSSTELLVESIPSLQLTLGEQREEEKKAAEAAEAAEAASGTGVPKLDLEGEGEGEEDDAAADGPEVDEDGNPVEEEDLSVLVRNIANGGPVACKVLVTLDGGISFIGADPTDAPASAEDGEDREDGEDAEQVAVAVPDPDGFALNYYKPEGGFTLKPPIGPRSGGTNLQVGASWLVPSGGAKLKFSKGEFTDDVTAPCHAPAPPAPEQVEGDAPAEGTEATSCTVEVVAPVLGNVLPPAPANVVEAEDEETEEATETAEEATETEDGEGAVKLLDPEQVEVMLALDGEEFYEEASQFTYYDTPTLSSIDAGEGEEGAQAGQAVTVAGRGFKLKGYENLVTVKLTSEEPKIEIVLGQVDGVNVNDRSVTFTMPDLAEVIRKQRAAAAAEATAAEAEAVDAADAGELSPMDGLEDEETEFEEETEAPDETEDAGDAVEAIEAFTLAIEVSLNSQQYHSASDPDEPLQVLFNPSGDSEDGA